MVPNPDPKDKKNPTIPNPQTPAQFFSAWEMKRLTDVVLAYRAGIAEKIAYTNCQIAIGKAGITLTIS